jgi:ATP:ADP antiporter, AAA family
MKLLGPGADARAGAAAATAAAVIIALQLAGKATRDAFFLSTFGVAALPGMMITAAIVSGVLAVMVARIMARSRPARLVPRLFALSAVLLLAEWALVGASRPLAAVLVYLHFTALGAILVSGFWAIVNERFDPRTARRTIGRITAAGSIGGLLGGILPERVGAALPLTAMLPILAVIALLASVLVLEVEYGSPARLRAGAEPDEQPILAASQVLRRSRYLLGLALLVALTSSAEGVLDYVFKAWASAGNLTGEQLLRFFAAFYTATALIAILVQVTALRPLLGRLGVARSASLLPAGVSAGAVGALLFPGLLSIILARGFEVILRSSFFRAAYELLFTPVAPAEKRATKLLLDVGGARIGDIVGAALILGALALTGAAAGPVLLALTFVLSGLALLVARQLHLGYVSALAGSIHRQTAVLPDPVQDDAAAWLQTVGGFDLTELRSRLAIPTDPAHAPEASPQQPESHPPHETPLQHAVLSGNAGEVRQALAGGRVKPEQVESVIDLLAWDAVAPAAIRALAEVAGSSTDLLLQHLLDPDEEFAIRRRLVNALANCPSPAVFQGLLQALRDRRFEVRYRAGRALSGMAGRIKGIDIDRDQVLGVVLKELDVERAVWESRELIDRAEEESSPMEAEVLQERVSRSLEHLFTLLSLILPRETLRLAFHALHTDDRYLRGTALEYLETILPDRVWERLSRILEPGPVPATARAKGSAEALDELLASRESITIALAEARRRGKLTPGSQP